MDTVIPFPNQKAVQAEAAAWVVRLDQEPLSTQETGELKSWLATSPVHAQVFRETVEVYGRADMLVVLSDLIPLEPAAQQESQRQFHFPVALAASVVAVFTTLLVFMWQGVWDPFADAQQDVAHYSTGIGGSKVVVLSDGSTLNLNTNTSVDIRFDDQTRRVNLERGEAYFEVAKNPTRPFIVYAGEGQVTAVGTAFSVYKMQGEVKVTVAEGKVAVQSDRAELASLPDSLRRQPSSAQAEFTPVKAVLLESGQAAIYNDQVVAELEEIHPEVMARKLIWQQGMLAFEAEPLENVIAEFSRYTELEIIIVDDDLKSVKVDGYFRLDDITGMLNSLQHNFGVEIARLDRDRISLKKGSL